ncbi:MAG TPA: hypothetical protein VHT49_08220 [Acidimicrobiales bacterium]|jgi:hypothetical protein|nr:hypothetical protein [Acidimicrobiales bacterium]
MHQVADLAIITVAAGLVALVTLAGVFTWRMVRKLRKWRARLEMVLPRSISRPGPDMVASAWSGAYRTSLAAGALVRTGSRREAMWLRRDLWSHVSAAEVAVKTAAATGTPVGQLPHLIGHLRDQAQRHDQVLILASKGVPVVGSADARAETGRIIDQANAVSAAVVDAVRADAAIDHRQLATAIDHETRSVAYGASRVHSLMDAAPGRRWLPPPPDRRLPTR